MRYPVCAGYDGQKNLPGMTVTLLIGKVNGFMIMKTEHTTGTSSSRPVPTIRERGDPMIMKTFFKNEIPGHYGTSSNW